MRPEARKSSASHGRDDGQRGWERRGQDMERGHEGEAHPGLAERLGWARLAEPGGQPYEQIHLQAVQLGLHMPHCSPRPWMGV